jgi:hypothetical protein
MNFDFIRDPEFWKIYGKGLRDVANRGVAMAAGGPVDLATMAMRPFGYKKPDDEVFGSSEYFGRLMENAGMVGADRNHAAELLASIALPAGAVKAGPAVVRGVEQAAKNAMVPGAMNKQSGAIVWHGSPHKFDKFDASKIGTGEGAQAYGHGLYLADAKEVAEGYKKTLAADGFLTKSGEVFDPSQLQHLNVRVLARKGDLDGAINSARAISESDAPGARFAATDLQTLEAIKNSGGLKKNEGQLYKVDLPDEHIAKMLDWDKPLSQQPEAANILAGLAKSKNPRMAQYWQESAGLDDAGKTALRKKLGINVFDAIDTGGAAYQSLGQRNVENALSKAGIPGIRYLDGGSRGAGVGSSNYVVFPGNEDLLRILQRNDEVLNSLTGGMGGGLRGK